MLENSPLEKRFADKHWRLTLAVREVVGLLETAHGFLSAHDMAKLLDQRFDVTTIYRILEKLQTLRLVHKFGEKWKWCTDLENQKESHHFLCCDRCGGAEEIFLNYHQAIAAELEKEKGFMLKKVQLGFLGTCRRCLAS